MKKNIFEKNATLEILDRINQLNVASQPVWGTMNVEQMLAHCNVTYDMIYTSQYPKPKGLKKFFLKALVKGIVVGDKPYKKNSRTAPEFLIGDERVFEDEKQKLVNYIKKTQELGEKHFNHKDSHSFGILTSNEWSNMFYKHLDHHLSQFGV